MSENEIVFVDFWASWCGPCRQFAPVYEKAALAHPDVVFGKVDTEAERALAGAAQITSIPTLMAFKNGTLVFSQPGALPATALEQVIAAVREFDPAQAASDDARQAERLMSSYTLGVTLERPYEETVRAVRSALETQGFGVLTEIDLQATLKKKLDVDVAPQVILGACRPALAYQALQVDPSIATVLPCNVVVRASTTTPPWLRRSTRRDDGPVRG